MHRKQQKPNGFRAALGSLARQITATMQASRGSFYDTKKIFGVLYKREQQASRQRVELLSVTAALDGSVTSGACAEKSGGRARSERELKFFPVFLAEMRKAR